MGADWAWPTAGADDDRFGGRRGGAAAGRGAVLPEDGRDGGGSGVRPVAGDRWGDPCSVFHDPCSVVSGP